MNTTTFHEGERAMQRLAGSEEHMASIGPRVIRSAMPDQHRQFFTQLPFVVAGSVDAGGQPWASVLAQSPGFISSPDATRLQVHALPAGHDPLARTLVPGAPLGLLGIEPHTRRRNRMNGTVEDVQGDGFTVRVDQSFGNCPKYIQAREPLYLAGQHAAGPATRNPRLDASAVRQVQTADTFFIATAHPEALSPQGPSHGVDVSHRGGKPGFVRVSEDAAGQQWLTAPDFVGNFFFNTLGNIAVNPQAGLLFIDFNSGDLLYVAVQASVVWDGPELASFAGAQRLLQMRVVQTLLTPAALPLRWGPAQQSPVLAPTGAWH